MGLNDYLKQKDAKLEEERKQKEAEERQRNEERERASLEEERKYQEEATINHHPLRRRDTVFLDDYIRGQLLLRDEVKSLDKEMVLLKRFAISLGISQEHLTELEHEVAAYDDRAKNSLFERLPNLLKQTEDIMCFICDLVRLHGVKFVFEGEFLNLWRNVCTGLLELDKTQVKPLEFLCLRISEGNGRQDGDDFEEIPEKLITYYLFTEYLVIDLSAGENASSYPYRFTNEPPNLAQEACRTTELWLRHIPAGKFIMGNQHGGLFTVETPHWVILTQDFYIGIFQCTQRQYELVTGHNPSEFTGEDHPVERVSYDDLRGTFRGSSWPYHTEVDSDSFFGIMQEKTGLSLDLPTEAQWEYACRAGTTRELNSGKRITNEQKCTNLDELGRYKNNGGEQMHHARVGSYSPNAWGLYDCHGNVSEWCLDWHDDYRQKTQENPRGANSGNERVNRGGGWYSRADFCRAESRSRDKPSYISNGKGFRIALRF